VIHEDSAKEHLAHLLKGDHIDSELVRLVFNDDEHPSDELRESCSGAHIQDPKLPVLPSRESFSERLRVSGATNQSRIAFSMCFSRTIPGPKTPSMYEG